MSLGTAIILSLLAGFAYFSRRFMGDFFLERPIVVAPITGLIMGDFHTGLVVGGTLELVFMGASDIGGSVPPNYNIGSILGTAFGIAAHQGIGAAILIAIPAALLGSFFELLAKTVSVFFVNVAERYADRGQEGGIAAMVHLGNAVHYLAEALPTFVALAIGVEAVRALAAAIPQWLYAGINLAGNMLPALGFALLLNSLVTPAVFPWFFIGFLFAAYTQFNVVGIAGVAVAVAVLIQLRRAAAEAPARAPAQSAPRQPLRPVPAIAGGSVSAAAVMPQVTPADIRLIWWRGFALQSAFSFDRMQALGFTWALIPFLKKTYQGQPQRYVEALKRHLVFFNTHPWLHGSILALTADMEARRAAGDDIDGQAIQGMKSGLMGPLAGIGDSMFHGTARPLMGGVCASLALTGNPIAPFLFIAVLGVLHVWVYWQTLDSAYRLGQRALSVFTSSALRRVMDSAAMVGLMTVGALTAAWISVGTPLTYTVGKTSVSIQAMLDGIMPKILPLALVLIVFGMVRRRVKTTTLMLSLIAASLILGGFAILK
ncbi:MAG TPA: PTS system mannose/fructose/sorbose family transporter subunit IID [bacterium]|nr:PTS system mannose/fructose/sorbose family transporter subunit IID [bacterium]